MEWLQLLSIKRFGESDSRTPQNQFRSAFEVDYDRIIFSHPFRRLQDKTQVFPLPEHDFVHTRLTHSLEVSSVGRSLGKRVGEEIIRKSEPLQKAGITPFDFGAIVASASLAHDLGNPPFGHSGESAISDFFLNNPVAHEFKSALSEKEWADLIKFEGNAQGFRILNKKGSNGLKLTFAALASFTKYPRESLIGEVDPNRKSHKKFGLFQSEIGIYAELAKDMGLKQLSDSDKVWCRHPLAFLVEAADDICYSIIDFEDGCRLGLVTLHETIELFSEIIGEKFDSAKLAKIKDKDEKVAVLRAMAISRLIEESAEVFLENEPEILTGEFDSALTSIISSAKILDEIESLSINRIYRCDQVVEREAAGYSILDGLLSAFCLAAFNKTSRIESLTGKQKGVLRLLPESIQLSIKEQHSPYGVIQCVTDFVSGLTDSYALTLYQRINGISVPMNRQY